MQLDSVRLVHYEFMLVVLILVTFGIVNVGKVIRVGGRRHLLSEQQALYKSKTLLYSI